ncbi:MAG: TPM domain-containing protein [Simplicispira suum]|uniref:TPM domain-containing protein n=1 Tax=Simplicispira suum TaxID=2109915 RepID=UPI001C6CD015|nr:TPM domain-containing protein [Simplicispira suum]MBW7834964.1 TPM domain-containing protein [Simplicispira suum]
MPLSLIWQGFIAIYLIAFLGVQAHSETLPAVPALSGHVIDQTGTLDALQRSAMERRLVEIEQKMGAQLVVLMVSSTAPEDIAAFANRVGNVWKIGRREVGDGVLIVVAKDDRKMRIEVAKTLEGAIPDLAAARIIDEIMKPRFRSGDFAGGLNAAIEQLAARIAGEPLPEPAGASEEAGQASDWMALAVFLLFGLAALGSVARAIFGKRLGAGMLGAVAGALVFVFTTSWWLAVLAAVGALLFVLFSSGGRGATWSSGGGGGWSGGSAGGWESSSDGGGFSSGGGGDFGGGGASGDW